MQRNRVILTHQHSLVWGLRFHFIFQGVCVFSKDHLLSKGHLSLSRRPKGVRIWSASLPRRFCWMDCVPWATCTWRLFPVLPSTSPPHLTHEPLPDWGCQIWAHVLPGIAEEPEEGRAWGFPGRSGGLKEEFLGKEADLSIGSQVRVWGPSIKGSEPLIKIQVLSCFSLGL